MFTHPFTKKLRSQISYNFNYSKQKNDRNTYDLSGFMEEAEVQPGYLPEGYETSYIDSLSNRSHSSTLQHGINLFFNYSDTTWNVNAGMSVKPERRSLNQKQVYIKPIPPFALSVSSLCCSSHGRKEKQHHPALLWKYLATVIIRSDRPHQQQRSAQHHTKQP